MDHPDLSFSRVISKKMRNHSKSKNAQIHPGQNERIPQALLPQAKEIYMAEKF